MIDGVGPLLHDLGIRFEEMPLRSTWAAQQRWREAFSAAVKKRTGKWTYLNLDWHAFSYDFTPSLKGDAAREAYRRAKAVGFYVLPEGKRGHGFKCAGKTLPDPSRLGGADLYVSPLDFSWTMAFTHEEPELGPYFSAHSRARP